MGKPESIAPSEPDKGPPPTERCHRPGAIEWLPTIISALAAIFAGGLWWEAHEEVIGRPLLIRPSVYFFIQDDDSERRIGLAVANSGPGIAIVKSIAYYVDRKPMTDGDAALTAGQLDPNRDHGTDLDTDDSIGVGETVWLVDYRSKDRKDRERFLGFLDDHLAAKVSYCSIAGDQCRQKCSTKGWCD